MEIPADPKETSFYKAMQLCDGVVVVLDGKATPFTRVWCCFEFAVVVLGEKLLLDFATVHNGKPQLLTEGLASEEDRPWKKVDREKRFPLRVMEKGYDIQIESAQATRDEDKRNIMNSITKKPLDSTPDPSDEAFSRVNRTLRSMLAEHAARHSAVAWPGSCRKRWSFFAETRSARN